MSNLKLDDLITLGAGDDAITGKVISMYNSPEIRKNTPIADVLNLPDGSESDYLSVGLAGYRIIKLQVEIDSGNENSTILSSIKGAKTYIINDEAYFIQSIDSKIGETFRISTITLISNQEVVTNPDNPVFSSKVFSFEITSPVLIYTLDEIVKGSNILITGLDTSDPRINFQVYKYSDDDVFLNDSIFNPFFFEFILSQTYLKDGNTETETWSGSDYQLSIADNVFVINDLGVSVEAIVYEIYAPFGNPIVRELTK